MTEKEKKDKLKDIEKKILDDIIFLIDSRGFDNLENGHWKKLSFLADLLKNIKGAYELEEIRKQLEFIAAKPIR